MSNLKNRFIKLIKEKGWKIGYVNWSAISYNGRDGREGGWEISLDLDDEDLDKFHTSQLPILGFNYKEVLTAIEKLPTKK